MPDLTRRARYAQEIHAAGPLAMNGPETIADAVMAVADEELREQRDRQVEQTVDLVQRYADLSIENQRLREELEKDAAITMGLNPHAMAGRRDAVLEAARSYVADYRALRLAADTLTAP